MKKALSLFLAIIMVFGIAAVGITEAPHVHAEEAVTEKITSTENNFVYEVTDGLATVIDYTDKESTDEIIIPDTLGGYPVRYLAAESFKGCRCIAITIPASVTRIDHEAFAYDMPNIERFNVLQGNIKYRTIGDGVLYSTDDYAGMLYLFAYPKNAPAETFAANGDAVASLIGPYAFSEAANLREVSINGVIGSAVDNYAFYNAKKLEKVTFHKALAIGDYAFAGCSSLTEVDTDGAVQWLGWDSFKDTPFINNPENYDEDGVFYHDENLLATLPEADKTYYEIKPGTVTIAGGAFDWDSLKEVYLPTSVNWITANPFARCCNIEKFTVDSTGHLKTDETGVLREGNKIIAYPNGIYQSCYVVGTDIEYFTSYAFYLSPIKNFYIHSDIEDMPYLALGGEEVTDIHYGGNEASWEQNRHNKLNYEKITAAEDVAEIHYNDYSAGEHEVTVSNEMHTVCTCGYTAEYVPGEGDFYENGFSYNVVNEKAVIVSCTKTSSKMIIIPETLGGYDVTRILDKAFVACTCTSIVIPATVRDFGLDAFWALETLQKITVSPDNVYYSSDSNGVLYNADKTELLLYPKNASASTYRIADTVKEIAPFAFYTVNNLKEITVSSNVEKIGDFAFENASIKKLVIEDGVKSIGNSAFYACETLADVTLPDTLEYIGYEAFDCTKFIENAANYDSDGVLYYGDYLLSTTPYESNPGFVKVGYIVKKGTRLIASSAIRWTGLKSIALPESVEFIGGSAFSRATSLEIITVNGYNKHFSVDDCGVLYNYDKTKLVAYPVGREEICYGIPSGVTEIGEWAFGNVQKLKCVNIPLSVTEIGAFSFGTTENKRVSSVRYEGTRVDWEEISFGKSTSGWIDNIRNISKTFSTYSDGEHTTASHTIKEPTCLKRGEEQFICSCGYKYTKELPAKGHKAEDDYRIIYEPRCETRGQKKLFCSVCEAELAIQYIPALGHDKEFVEYIEPTCKHYGGSLYWCKRCETKIFEEDAEPTDHNKEFVEYIEPTCYSPGGSHYRCTMCEADFYVEEEPMLEHVSSGETVRIEPTCISDGGLYYVCELCGDPMLDEWIEIYYASGHTEGEWKCVQEATCKKKLLEVLYCTDCNKALKQRVGNYGDHNYIGTVVEQTCEKVTMHYVCSVCGDEYYDDKSDSTIGHILEKIVIEPTCTEAGKSYDKCTVCGKTVGEVIETEALGHTWSDTIIKEPTCSKEGIKSTTCTVCGEKDEEVAPKLAHTFGSWKYESGNTFSGICSVCGEGFDSLEVELAFNQKEVTLYNKTSKVLSVTVTENISDDITFSSSDSSIVHVYSNGKITAKAPGHATITAKLKGTDITATCKITVAPRNFGVEWICDGESFEYTFVEEGSTITPPEAPVKSGFVFVGWTPEIPEVMPSSGLTLTAVYNIVSQSPDYDVSATYSIDAFDEPVSLDVNQIEGEREPGGVYMVDGENYNQVGLYNIKAINEIEQVVQPNEGHTVRIKLALPEQYRNRTSFVIYHRFVDGTREQLSTAKGNLWLEDGYLVFDVSSFSEFEVLAISSSIKITKLPDKTTYNYNANGIDLTGIEITFKNSNGKTKKIDDPSHLTVTGFDSTKLGKQTVTVHYGQYADTMQVNVRYSFWQMIIGILTFGLIRF